MDDLLVHIPPGGAWILAKAGGVTGLCSREMLRTGVPVGPAVGLVQVAATTGGPRRRRYKSTAPVSNRRAYPIREAEMAVMPGIDESQQLGDSEAEYTLEYVAVCPSCRASLRAVRAIR